MNNLIPWYWKHLLVTLTFIFLLIKQWPLMKWKTGKQGLLKIWREVYSKPVNTHLITNDYVFGMIRHYKNPGTTGEDVSFVTVRIKYEIKIPLNDNQYSLHIESTLKNQNIYIYILIFLKTMKIHIEYELKSEKLSIDKKFLLDTFNTYFIHSPLMQNFKVYLKKINIFLLKIF